MFKKILANINFVAGTALTLTSAYEMSKYYTKKIAEVETVNSSTKYVLVKLARGHYKTFGGPETMMYDYKFFKIISKFHE